MPSAVGSSSSSAPAATAQESNQKQSSSNSHLASPFFSSLWVYIVRSMLFVFSMLIVLVNHTVINVKFLQQRISRIVTRLLVFHSVNRSDFSFSTQETTGNNQPKVIDQSNELTREEMTQFALERGGPISRVVSNPTFKTFYIHRGDIRGLIPYRLAWNTVTVLGDPICSDDSVKTLREVCEAFYQYCSQLNYQIVYAAVSQEFVEHLQVTAQKEESLNESEIPLGTRTITKTTDSSVSTQAAPIQSEQAAAAQPIPCGIMQFGETLYYKPHSVNTKQRLRGRKQRGLASKLSQAKRCGITTHEYVNNLASSDATNTNINDTNSNIRNDLVHVADAWLSNRKGIQAYVSPIDVFSDTLSKRYFYALHKKDIVAIAVIVLLEKYNGYMIKNVLVHPTKAPKGTSELLVMNVLETLGNEGIDYVTFGPGPSPQVFQHVEGFDMATSLLFKILRACSDAGYLKASSSTYDYRRKFSADKSEPTYLVFYRQGTLSVFNALSILNTFHILASVTDTSSGTTAGGSKISGKYSAASHE